jgi:mono/diheme cytochrome c family protein
MRLRGIISGGLLLIGTAGYALTLPSGSSVAATPPPSATPRSGELVYQQSCGYCHGRNVGPVIRGRALPQDYIRQMVRQGQNAMPAFRPSEISEPELAAVAAFIAKSKADSKEHGQ